MLFPILSLLISFVAATALGLAGAYLFGTAGAVIGMAAGILATFYVMARRAGR